MTYATARDIGLREIPIIDVAPLVEGAPGATQRVAREMRKAAEGIGFFYVRNHQVPGALIDAAFAIAHHFFHLPAAEKAALAISPRHRGFLGVGGAKMEGNRRSDLKESFVWGLDVAAEDPDVAAPEGLLGANRWPEAVPNMRAVLMAYFDATHVLGRRLLDAFAVALGVKLDHFTARFDRPVSRGSLIHYPPQPPDLGADQFGVAPHTDYGCLTLLAQDATGGLQVRGRSGEWVTAHPVEGALVVNVGDLLARWTNDRFASTPHRVVNRSGHERFSVAMFIDPNAETQIAPVCAPGEAPHYTPVSVAAYIRARYDAAFAYRHAGGG